jgi:predicted peroxiredoxin
MLMGKVVITCNGSEPSNLYPPFIIGSSALASGDELLMFLTPSAAPAFKKGVIENIKKKGLPDLLELYNSVQELGGKVIFCELGLAVHDFKEDDLREGLEIAGATTFVKEAEGSTLSLSF